MTKQPPREAPAPRTGPQAPSAPKHAGDDLVVPKGVSRGQFLFLVGLLIFLLVIFMVPDSCTNIAGGRSSLNPVVVRFERPGQGRVEWRYSERVGQERLLADALSVDFFLATRLGVDLRRPGDDLVRILVLDQIARDAGIEVTDADLRKHLDQILDFTGATKEDFKNAVRANGFDQRAIEETIRKLMRVARFQQFLAFSGAVPDPAEIEEQWRKDNVEFAFEYVALAVADMRDAARAELPDDAGLRTWFEALPEEEKAQFRTAEKRTAEWAVFRDQETTPAGELLAAYPAVSPEGAEPVPPEELAQTYYDSVYAVRFARPKEEGAGEETVAGFFPFAEVREACLAEAPVYFAMQRWIEGLSARRAAGEAIDFAAEAQRLGLEHGTTGAARSEEEFVSAAELGGLDAAGAVFATEPDGSFHESPVALATGLAVLRVNARTEPELPPFETIRDAVAEEWLGPRAEELARTRLAQLREASEAFEPVPAEAEEDAPPPPEDGKPRYRATSEAFRAAAEAAGLVVSTRDYLNKAGPASKDPRWEEEEHRTLFTYANSMRLYDLQPDELAEPGTGADRAKFYLVRLAGKREVPLEDMSPAQYARYRERARNRAVADFGAELDLDYLRANYGLWLAEDDAGEGG
jgi:parvulin-like peptidyl-prolyl isomerase